MRMRNSSRTWLAREMAAFAKTVPEGSVVLDAGAGSQSYRPLFGHCRYESADFQQVDKAYAPTTYICDIKNIPVEDARFDAVIFNQCMEHLPDPLAVLKELRRVSKPGAPFICTAPLFYEEHERPYDFYRYTQFGWRHLLKEADLTIDRLDWMDGYFGTVGYGLECAGKYLPRSPTHLGGGISRYAWSAFLNICRPVFKLLALAFYILDERTRYTKSGFPKNYIVLAHRRA
jgi:SAM-dependent methyltransferase